MSSSDKASNKRIKSLSLFNLDLRTLFVFNIGLENFVFEGNKYPLEVIAARISVCILYSSEILLIALIQ